MELLVCVVHQPDKLNPILEGLAELGITGATLLDSRGMVGHLPDDAPVLAGLKDLLARSRPENKTVFSVVESEQMLEAAVAMIQRVLGNMESPGTGILFTVPVTRAVGVRRSQTSGAG